MKLLVSTPQPEPMYSVPKISQNSTSQHVGSPLPAFARTSFAGMTVGPYVQHVIERTELTHKFDAHPPVAFLATMH